MKRSFFKSKLFSYYIDEGIYWFKVYKIGLSIKDINKCVNADNTLKGIFVWHWLISIIK